MKLEELGWGEFFENQLSSEDKQLIPARVVRQDLSVYQLLIDKGTLAASLPGKFRRDALSKADLPTVGDWTLVNPLDGEADKAIIRKLLRRKSCFSRKEAGGQLNEQIVAANIDTVFIVCGLDDDFNAKRIERYLLLAWESGAVPQILLNKADLCDDLEEKLSMVKQVAPGVDINTISGLTGEGVSVVSHSIRTGQTGALLGSSGVGKSTIINTLLGFDRFPTGSVRKGDSKGRHTTTFRELVQLPDGGLLIDTPGMREIQIWGNETALSQTFDDLEALSIRCKFRDCSHIDEPGCAVKNAIETGELDETRLSSYTKLQRELNHLAAQQDIRARQDRKKERKRFSRLVRKRPTKRD